jgi:transcription-repair coupling factor (superfamily II helicase)
LLAPLADTPLTTPVNVDLPLPVNIPASYVPDRDARLRLYRRLADLRSIVEIETLAEEFKDRFGPLPDETANLLFQLKVKILAEKAGLVSVSGENNQVVLRYPALPDNAPARTFPDIPVPARTGKNGIWLPVSELEDWQPLLLELLQKLP